MLRFLRNKISGWKKLAGVELILLSEGFEIRVCILEKKKGIISILKSKSKIESLEELKAFLEEGIPIALTISGKGILSKKLENTHENDINKHLLHAIPNAKPADFYLQLFQDSKLKYLSLVRKPVADDVLTLFHKENLHVISLSLGGLLLHSLQVLQGESFVIQSVEHRIEVKDGSVVQYSYGQTPEQSASKIKLGDDEISVDLVLAYTSAFQQVLPDPVQAQHAQVSSDREEFLEKQMFTTFGWFVLSFFLAVLLINYIVFTWLSQETEKFTMASGLQKSQVVQLKNLQKEVGEKNIFLKSAGWMNTSKASFYADRIAATIPPSVLVTSLEVNPIDEKASRDQRKQIFTDELIVITGNCKRPIELNGWIKRLKDFSWVQKVNVENYNYDSEEKAGTFKVEITF